MDRWSQRIENGQALALAREIKSIAETSPTSSPDEVDHLNRLFRIAELVEWTLENVDAWLVSDTTLANLTTHLQQGRDYLTNWKGGSGVEYLTVHAPTVLDNGLAILGSIPVGTTAAEAMRSRTSCSVSQRTSSPRLSSWTALRRRWVISDSLRSATRVSSATTQGYRLPSGLRGTSPSLRSASTNSGFES